MTDPINIPPTPLPKRKVVTISQVVPPVDPVVRSIARPDAFMKPIGNNKAKGRGTPETRVRMSNPNPNTRQRKRKADPRRVHWL